MLYIAVFSAVDAAQELGTGCPPAVPAPAPGPVAGAAVTIPVSEEGTRSRPCSLRQSVDQSFAAALPTDAVADEKDGAVDVGDEGSEYVQI
nr:hypothetical protein Iba_scaffold20755CG0060 [Ipomoea batatas]